MEVQNFRNLAQDATEVKRNDKQIQSIVIFVLKYQKPVSNNLVGLFALWMDACMGIRGGDNSEYGGKCWKHG